MMPLLGREGLLVPCAVCTILYVGASVVSTLILSSLDIHVVTLVLRHVRFHADIQHDSD